MDPLRNTNVWSVLLYVASPGGNSARMGCSTASRSCGNVRRKIITLMPGNRRAYSTARARPNLDFPPPAAPP